MNLIDTHCHIDLPEFKDDFQNILDQAKSNNIYKLINIGATNNLSGAHNTINLVNNYPQIFGSVGIHPNDASNNNDFDIIKSFVTNKKVVAIGETGLDFYWEYAQKNDQYKYFDNHINLSLETKKPLIIHSRNTAEECINHLKNYSGLTGVFHCFTYDYDVYKKIIDLGFIISITGIVTFKNAKTLHELIKKVDLNHIMLETDSPYMSPEPYRGKRNQPANILEIAKKIAEIKDITLDEVAEVTTKTAEKIFNLE